MPRYAFLVLEEHPYGREMLRALLDAGMVPALLVEESSPASELEHEKFLERFAGFPIAPTFSELLEGLELPRHVVASHNDEACAALLREASCELLVLGGTRILRRHVFEAAPKTLNAHPGLLPEVRGSASVAWAIERDVEIGCTTHLIDAGIDTGPIIERERIPVYRGDSYEKLCYETCRLCAQMMTRAVLAEARGELRTEPQRGEGLTHRNMPADGVARIKAKLAAGRYRHARPLPEAAAAVVMACVDFDAELSFWCDELGFRVERIFPAHAPRSATLRGHGLRLVLERAATAAGDPLRLQLVAEAPVLPAPRRSPGGAQIEWRRALEPIPRPPNKARSAVVRRGDGAAARGRAGMIYRDLSPARGGGAFIASHITIPEGGPVPDYVHYHRVEAQLIYCHRGEVEVVYEDQGEPLTMRAGDCVLQPPTIRHRVLRASPGLEVVELSSPAEHETLGDLELELPNGLDPGRSYGGQRFHLHVAREASWQTLAEGAGSARARDLGLCAPSMGRIEARAIRARAGFALTRERDEPATHELELVFVTEGELRLRLGEGGDPRWEALSEGDAFGLAPGSSSRLEWISEVAEVLELRLRRSSGP